MVDTKKVDVLLYKPGTTQPIPLAIEIPKEHHYKDLNRTIGALLGVGNHIEHVSVLFRNREHDMFVDEFSALPVHHGRNARLPVNDAATLIYHEASRQRGDDLTDAPKIYGPALITLARVWD